jgi:hypothetical protein
MAIDSPLATGAFWTATGERAIRTFAQAMLGMMTVSDRVLGILDVNWPGAFSVSAFAALYSILMSVSVSSTGNPGPSLANERLAIRPQTGRHAKRDPEDEALLRAEQEQYEADEQARERAREDIEQQLGQPVSTAHPSTPQPPPRAAAVDHPEWLDPPDHASPPPERRPDPAPPYVDPPTERNLRPVNLEQETRPGWPKTDGAHRASIDDLLTGPDSSHAAGSHRGQP